MTSATPQFTVSIRPEHKDTIHDLAYDFYGKKLATCSSDQNVKIWENGEDGKWFEKSCWKAHHGSVWRVTWAHPEFGQILATCSFDRTVRIWEEIVTDKSTAWVSKGSIADSRANITDVKFAPKHMGLQLAFCCQDGSFIVEEAPDIMNLNNWIIIHKSPVWKIRCSCIAWNLSRHHVPFLAVGSDDVNTSGPKIAIFEQMESNNSKSKWQKSTEFCAGCDGVYDLAFAPNMGRDYHLLAVASRNLLLYKIVENLDVDMPFEGIASSRPGRLQPELIATLTGHASLVWRVNWNITGAVLASCGQDGTVRLWKRTFAGEWTCLQCLEPKENSVESDSMSHLGSS